MFEDVIILFCTHLAVFWLGYRWGIHSAVIRIISNYMNNPKDIEQAFKQISDLKSQADEPDDKAVVYLRAEWVGEQVYLYREDTNEFLGQGTDVHTAISNITQLTPGVSYEIPAGMAKKPQAVQP
jgi:hypothetical protein